jgi:hypothetical protein
LAYTDRVVNECLVLLIKNELEIEMVVKPANNIDECGRGAVLGQDFKEEIMVSGIEGFNEVDEQDIGVLVVLSAKL